MLTTKKNQEQKNFHDLKKNLLRLKKRNSQLEYNIEIYLKENLALEETAKELKNECLSLRGQLSHTNNLLKQALTSREFFKEKNGEILAQHHEMEKQYYECINKLHKALKREGGDVRQ